MPVSFLVLRLRGGQFAIGTWVVAEVFALLVTLDKGLGGGTGISLRGLNMYDPETRRGYTYWLTLAFTVVLVSLLFALLRSRNGAALQAIRDDEDAAAASGVRVVRLKLLLFVLGSFGCGAAGALILANTLFIQPQSIFGVQWTAYMIFMVLVGGLGTIEGPIIGALVFFGVQYEFADQGAWYLIGLGATAVAFALLLPARAVGPGRASGCTSQLLPVGYRLQRLNRRRPDGEALTSGSSSRRPGRCQSAMHGPRLRPVHRRAVARRRQWPAVRRPRPVERRGRRAHGRRPVRCDARLAVERAHEALPAAWSHSAPAERQADLPDARATYLRAVAREVMDWLAAETGCGHDFGAIQLEFALSLLRQAAGAPYNAVGQVHPVRPARVARHGGTAPGRRSRRDRAVERRARAVGPGDRRHRWRSATRWCSSRPRNRRGRAGCCGRRSSPRRACPTAS